ncbi:bifunctional glycosyltransferase family 2/GtrA family protein [Marinilactibacillus kalidii]|uniref:bifunctional glycosyltransferase family 2/GtrA family protein n=1 Tax=Marinilactibacillus kalidii TaxID=2820274 RepID=UPI001ABE777B|nr:bifunctional glycosyltransferase family 2/GtrA family protein [Marinilactibacillus kalidii]
MKNKSKGNQQIFKDLPIVIPALNPDSKLLNLIYSLLNAQSELSIIVVDDGSNIVNEFIWDEIKSIDRCTLLRHSTNLGKGAALKTGFQYILTQLNEISGIATVDADGQHSPEDIIACMTAFKENPSHIIMGSRSFKQSNIPLRSKFGNQLTYFFLKAIHHIRLSDSQTGLRVIPSSAIPTLLSLPGDRYEYEMNMLLSLHKQHYYFKEVKIETIYLNDNQSSHFNPLLDSIRIYAVFFKYGFSSFVSFIVDIVVFYCLFHILNSGMIPSAIFIATVGARILSSLTNYFTNQLLVFKSAYTRSTLIKYFALVLLQMSASGLLVQLITERSPINSPLFIKLMIDLTLFIISFQIQKNWIFNQSNKERNLHFE